MALSGYMTDLEEAAPITSRSPSFVRLKEADAVKAHADIEELVTESEPPTLTYVPRSPDSSQVRARSAEHAVDLEVRTLQLEESSRAIADERVAAAVRGLVDDIEDVRDFLTTAPLAQSQPIVQHVYEWAVNVVAQADARIVAATRGEEPIASIGLSLAEYSSLFVRAIILPMIEETVAERRAAHDYDQAEALDRLRDLVAWVNWSLRRIAPADG